MLSAVLAVLALSTALPKCEALLCLRDTCGSSCWLKAVVVAGNENSVPALYRVNTISAEYF